MENKNLKYGLLAGFGTVAFFLLFYFFSKKWMLHPSIYWSSLAFYIIFMAKGVFEKRSRAESIDFRLGLQTTFTIFLIANAVFWVFYLWIFKFDPGLLEVQKTVQIELLEQSAKLLGGNITDVQIENAIESIKNSDNAVTFSTIVFGYARGAIGGFVLAAIITFIIRKF